MKDLKINIQELALLMNVEPREVSTHFKGFCLLKDIPYRSRLELPIQELGVYMQRDLVKAAENIRDNYLKFADTKSKILNDKKGVKDLKFKSPLTALKKFLKPEDLAIIEESWKRKNQELNNQLNLL
jgi:hypothetical protein